MFYMIFFSFLRSLGLECRSAPTRFSYSNYLMNGNFFLSISLNPEGGATVLDYSSSSNYHFLRPVRKKLAIVFIGL